MKPYIVVLTLATMILALLGCQRTDNDIGDTMPSDSSVEIVSVSPIGGAALRVGERVRIRVDIAYTLVDEVGTVEPIVQTADDSRITSTLEVVKKGSGKLTLASDFVVPKTNAIQIFTALAGEGQTATSVVDSRIFEVDES